MGKKRESKRIKQFDDIEQVNMWYLANTNEKQARKHKRKLQIVCSTLKISPESLIMDIPPEQQIIKIKEILAKFVRAVKEGKLVHTHNNKQKHITDFNEYETALKLFCGHFHHVPPPETRHGPHEEPLEELLGERRLAERQTGCGGRARLGALFRCDARVHERLRDHHCVACDDAEEESDANEADDPPQSDIVEAPARAVLPRVEVHFGRAKRRERSPRA